MLITGGALEPWLFQNNKIFSNLWSGGGGFFSAGGQGHLSEWVAAFTVGYLGECEGISLAESQEEVLNRRNNKSKHPEWGKWKS